MITEAELESLAVLLRDARFEKRLTRLNKRIDGGEAVTLDGMASALRISRRQVELGLIAGAIRPDLWVSSLEHVARWRELNVRVDAGEMISLEEISEFVAAPPEVVRALMASASAWPGKVQ